MLLLSGKLAEQEKNDAGISCLLNQFIYLYFKVFFIDYAITVFPIPPFYPPSTLHPQLSSILPPLVHVVHVHISSLSSLFPIPFLSLPVYFMPTNYASSSLCLFPPIPLLPISTEIPPCDLRFSDSVTVLVICLVCFCFCIF